MLGFFGLGAGVVLAESGFAVQHTKETESAVTQLWAAAEKKLAAWGNYNYRQITLPAFDEAGQRQWNALEYRPAAQPGSLAVRLAEGSFPSIRFVDATGVGVCPGTTAEVLQDPALAQYLPPELATAFVFATPENLTKEVLRDGERIS